MVKLDSQQSAAETWSANIQSISIGDGERLELKQQATNRSLYAKGAISAVKWAHGKENGLYTMRDVLGI